LELEWPSIGHHQDIVRKTPLAARERTWSARVVAPRSRYKTVPSCSGRPIEHESGRCLAGRRVVTRRNRSGRRFSASVPMNRLEAASVWAGVDRKRGWYLGKADLRAPGCRRRLSPATVWVNEPVSWPPPAVPEPSTSVKVTVRASSGGIAAGGRNPTSARQRLGRRPRPAFGVGSATEQARPWPLAGQRVPIAVPL